MVGPTDVTVFGNVTSVRDLDEGKMVTVELRTPRVGPSTNVEERIRDFRARARALVGAGFAKEGFLRKADLELDAPKLRRRTDIVSKKEIEEGLWSYDIRVRPGVILQ